MYTVQQLNAMLEAGWSSEKTTVIGNESCDMDSVVSSLAHSLVLQVNDPSGSYIPVLNVSRDDLPLRTEALFALKEFGVDVEKLVFAPEVDLSSCSRVVLVDHNEPCPAQDFLSKKVVGIIDHHADGNKFTDLDAPNRIIELVGSASSLVAREGIKHCTAKDSTAFDSSMASLLLGTILIDTMNHDPEVKKSTDVDKSTAALLATMFDTTRYPSPNDLYAKLSEVKFDSSSLTIAMHLRKDYKSFCFNNHKLGIAAVLESLPDLYKRGDFEQEIISFYKSRGLDTLMIMTLTVDGDTVTRTVAVYPPSSQLVEEFTSGKIAKEVGLTEANLIPEMPSFDQKDTAVSRKKLTPMIATFFEGK